MAVERPIVSTTMEAFGTEVPTSDAISTEGGVFKIDEPNALATPCDMVSMESTSTTAPKMARHDFAGVKDLPNDNLNQPY